MKKHYVGAKLNADLFKRWKKMCIDLGIAQNTLLTQLIIDAVTKHEQRGGGNDRWVSGKSLR